MCIFCEEIRNPGMARKIFGKNFMYDDRIIYSDKNILAMPGYGPQVYPYMLVMPRRHISSFLSVSREERESIFNFFDLIIKSKLYPGDELCIFEHGGESQSGCSSITHCHLHIIDGEIGLFDYISWKDNQENIILSRKNTVHFYHDYLLIGQYKKGKLVAKLNKSPLNEHQYFRKHLSYLLKQSEWDWNLGMNNDIYVPKLIDEAQKKLRR